MRKVGMKTEIEFSGSLLRMSYCGNGIWRIQSVKDNETDDFGAAQILSRDLGEEPFSDVVSVSTKETDSFCEVKASDGNCVKVDSRSITFFDADGKERKKITSVKVNNTDSYVTVALSPEDFVYGTGERFDKVNQRGRKLQIYSIDKWCRTKGNSYNPIPFVIISDCTAVYMNKFEHSVFSIKSTLKIKQKHTGIDLYVFISDSPEKILTSYSKITGFAPIPAEWNFGVLVCRYHPEFQTKEGVFAMSDAMEENDFPWDGIIMEGFRRWNKENFAELREISQKVHSDGKKLLVYDQCGRLPTPEWAQLLGLEDKHSVDSENGVWLHETRSMNLMDNFSRKNMRCIDLTSESSLKKWNEVWDEYLNDMLVDGAKIDFCEQFPDNIQLKFADGRKSPGAHHWYPVLYNTIMYKKFSTREFGGMNFSRGGGIGAQRYPFIWAGDQRREFYFLQPVVKAALSLGLSGVPYVSWDMSGYMPSFNPYDKKHEDRVFIRGLEFTAFSPVVQTHGKVKRPYDFDEHTKSVYRAYTKLHEALRPYFVEQSKVISETGLPMMRHLFLYDSSDIKCRGIEDEYMLGCGLLVAPILKNRYKRNIYLPKGDWINIFTGEEFKGGQLLKNYQVPLESIPVFKLKNADSEILETVLSDSAELINEINKLSDKG